MVYRDADQASLNMVMWDIQRGYSIEEVRKAHGKYVVIRDNGEQWCVVLRHNAHRQLLVPKEA